MKKMIPLLAACLLLAGCDRLPAAREMGDMALLRTLGVDRAPAGVAVTGSTGPRARGLQAEGEPALTLSADRASLSGACLAMQGQSDSYVFFGYVDQLLVGEELARQGVQPVLDYFARDAELSLGARLWLVRGDSARDAVSSGGNEGVDRRLETLRTDGEMGVASISRTAGEIYTDLLEQGAAFAPALTLTGAENNVLTEDGYAVLKDGALAGFLDGEAARGLELLHGGSSADMVEVELSDNRASVKVTSARTRSKLEFQGDRFTGLDLTCKVEARLSEYRQRLSRKEMEALKAALEQRERERIEAALEQLKELEADCTGLGAKAAMASPARWQQIQENWPEQFARAAVNVRVQATILD